MKNMRNALLFLALLATSAMQGRAQTEELKFPTGTSWEESWTEAEEVLTTHTYRVGETAIKDGRLYREVLRDGSACGKWIREEENRLWLLTEDFPEEIMLYDFHLESGKENVRQYVQGGVLREEAFVVTAIGHMQMEDGQQYDYADLDGTRMVKGIGVLSERRKDCCILGYLMPEAVIPDLSVCLLRSFTRNGQLLYRRDMPETGIAGTALNDACDGNGNTYDLYGRRVEEPRTKGIYIKNGRKVLLK